MADGYWLDRTKLDDALNRLAAIYAEPDSAGMVNAQTVSRHSPQRGARLTRVSFLPSGNRSAHCNNTCFIVSPRAFLRLPSQFNKSVCVA
jgi:hypothetical protein